MDKTALLQQLTATFKTELDEKLQIITDGLLVLEKNSSNENDTKKIIEEIFRAAHNIKGTARSIGIETVGEIAHHIESLFAVVLNKEIVISTDTINRCLQAIDGMHVAMQCHCDQVPLSFDLDYVLNSFKQTTPKQRLDKKIITTQKLSDSLSNSRNQLSVDTSINKRFNNTRYDTVRVALHQIDHVFALVEQIQTSKIALDAHSNQVSQLAIKIKQLTRINTVNSEQIKDINQLVNQIFRTLKIDINDLNLVINSLQEDVRMLRLVPASTLLRHLTRFVRSLAEELSKNVDLEIHGDNVKMDKMILEGVKDPILHLLRNAIDHGIENPTIRIKQEKSAIGKIIITVTDEGNQILIAISDDGGGIDYKKIARSAEKKGIVSKAELDSMNEASILDLIFRPDFSTKNIITTISGRGVGLDVVKSNVLDLKGNVTLSTKIGHGTTFNLRLPLTLSSDIGLVIRSGGQLFVIPTRTIEHVMILQTADIHDVAGTQIILFNNRPIPLITLSDILNLPNSNPKTLNQLPIIVLKKGWDSVALFVEDIVGEHEIVIKPLQPPLTTIPCVIGGTLLGTGEVIIVLNPSDIIAYALKFEQSKRIDLSQDKPAQIIKPAILLVDDSITTRTLEKNILEHHGYNVSAVVDGAQAWELLQKKSFSLVITDVEMPNMNGFDLTERIKKSEQLRNTPIIIVTSLNSEEQKKRGIEVGADAYIIKHDFESLELLNIVGQLI